MSRMPLPFRYPGGKYYAIDILRPFWENTEHKEYREPFAGGATVFFNKPKSNINWLNDLDSELMECYRIMQNPITRLQLCEDFRNEIASKDRWKEIYDQPARTPYEIGKKYFYLNRTSFSGKLSSPAWGYRPKRSLPPERWHERIIPCGEMLKNVRLTNVDFAEIIRSEGEDVLLYVDPPYYLPPKHKHYRHGFDPEDHIRLSEELRNCTHKFFLTYDDCPDIRRLYSWANIYEVKFFYRVDNSSMNNGNRQLGFELIISNYDVPQQMTLFEERNQ